MKLLLTSAGFVTNSIIKSLEALCYKPLSQSHIAFIPTAANVEEGAAWWLDADIKHCKQLGVASVTLVDISLLPQKESQKKLEAADILVFGGGNTFHLMHEVRASGLENVLPELLKTRVYVGISAGSMILTPDLLASISANLYEEEVGEGQSSLGLSYVPFYFLPHLNSHYFPHVTVEKIEPYVKDIPGELYAIDDQTAIQVIDEQITVISEGEWKKFH